MWATLHCLRRDGRRLPKAQLWSSPIGPGVLTLEHTQAEGGRMIEELVLELRQTSGAPGTGQKLRLFQPRMLALQAAVLRFEGFERIGEGDNARAVVQEWACFLEVTRE